MAIHKWIGAVAPVSKKSKLVVGTASAGVTYTMTSNDATVSYTAVTGDTEADVVAQLIALATALGREFRLMTFTLDDADADTFYAEAVLAGHDFDLSVNVNITLSSVATATGPNHWVAGNFDSGTLPISNDLVVFENNSADLLFGLDTPAALTGVDLEFRSTYTGRVGLPEVNSNGFPEYRDQHLEIGVNSVKVGLGPPEGAGSSRIKLDLQASSGCYVIVTRTGTYTTTPPVEIQNATSLDVAVLEGGIAIKPNSNGPTTNIDRLDMAGGECLVGREVTTTTIEQSGGEITTESNVTTVNQSDGILTVLDAAAITTVNLSGTALLRHSSRGNFGTVTIDDDSELDASGTTEDASITTLNMLSGRLTDPHGRLGPTTTQNFRTLQAS